MIKISQRHWRPYMVLFGFFLVMLSLYQWANTEHASANNSNDAFQQENQSDNSADEQPLISQEEFNDEANRTLTAEKITTPLLLQTNEQWSQTAYGQDGSQTIAENGCALLSLSMILAHSSSEKEVSKEIPQKIFDWAKDTYYIQGQGTDWRIFADFAQQFKFAFHDLGSDLTAANSYLEQNIPVVVSVTKGEFTDAGHIMVLAGSDQNGIRVLDPNDSPEKNHYLTEYSFDDIRSQSLHYWTYTNL